MGNLCAGSSENRPTNSHNFCAIIRHGERADDIPGFVYSQHKYDVPLTPKGLEQAKTTGKFLKKYLLTRNYKFDKIIIESSPFL